MLQMAIVFLVIGLIAAVLGFGGIAGASFAIAKFLAGLFLVLFSCPHPGVDGRQEDHRLTPWLQWRVS
jgi:uncharacterized membrane protein YtjA (UPF0391 family)